ncbi:MAG: TRAP transporter large permease subunit [Proteobacteria bacterium]|nr:TRAP transporter large permease subunit [Pseudomonadota bacterium]
MITTMIVCFFGLLLGGMAIAVMLAMTTLVCHLVFTGTSPMDMAITFYTKLGNEVLLCVPFFILAGGIMTEGSLARRLIDVVNVLFGFLPGGLAIAAISACAVFALLSGSSPATVVAIGSIMIPALIKANYGERFSIGLVTNAGSLGIVFPPSIPMILYCMVMSVSVEKLFMAGFMPGVLITTVFVAYTFLMALKHKWRTEVTYTREQALKILADGIWGLFLPVVVLGGIYFGVFTPTEAAAVSVIYALFVELVITRELKLKDLTRVCRESAILSACLLFILTAAFAFIELLDTEGIPGQMATFIQNVLPDFPDWPWLFPEVLNFHDWPQATRGALEHFLPLGMNPWWIFMIMVVVLFLIMGTVMENVSAMLILSPIFAGTLAALDIDLIHFGVVMVMVIEFGFLTPPFGLNLFVAMGLTKKSLVEVARASGPFLALLLGCVAIIAFIPEVSLFLPRLLTGDLTPESILLLWSVVLPLGLIAAACLYSLWALSLRKMARELGLGRGWMAWVPVVNGYLLCLVAGKPGWWLALLFVPGVNVVVAVHLWIKIFQRLGVSGWYSLLLLIPGLNLVVPAVLAFFKPSPKVEAGSEPAPA